jgi:single-stranded-DNA-specific exonuclease
MAVNQIRQALEQRVFITVVGDYDVDGMTASVLMYEVLKSLDAKVEIVIPDRRRDGYGISISIVEGIYNRAPRDKQLIITVDNGANAYEAIAKALELGMEVLVTDHHSVVNPNEGVTMVNPNNPRQPYVFSGLSGVGVAWKLARELLESFGYPEKAWDYMDLVALGTIADVSPLVDENRGLVKLGLQMITSNPRPGIQELIKIQLAKRRNAVLGKVSSFDIGMYLAPCLNAAGRIGEVMDAVDLLSCQDAAKSSQLASALVALNQERKRITEQGMQDALAQVSSVTEIPKIICLSLPDLDESVCGLVAGRIKETYYRPTLVFTRSGDAGWKGSGRSIAKFDLTLLMKAVAHISEGGGHPQACGFSFNEPDLDNFVNTVQLFGEEHIEDQLFTKVFRVDLGIEPSEVNLGLVREFEKLQPFGTGWEEPLVGLRGISVTGSAMGKNGDHLQLRCNRSGLIFKGWGMHGRYQFLGYPDLVDIIGKVRRNLWNHRESVEIEIVDFRKNIDIG